MRSRGKGVSYICLLVCSSVCLSVRSFSACLDVLGLFKVSFCLIKMALLNKLVLLCLWFERDHPEAQKSLFSCQLDVS